MQYFTEIYYKQFSLSFLSDLYARSVSNGFSKHYEMFITGVIFAAVSKCHAALLFCVLILLSESKALCWGKRRKKNKHATGKAGVWISKR